MKKKQSKRVPESAMRRAKKPARDFRMEWDFAAVPPNEREACFLYEYGREIARNSKFVLGLLSQFEARAKTGRYQLHLDFHRAFEAAFGRDFIPTGEFFPATPWRDLDGKIRSSITDGIVWRRKLRDSPFDKVKLHSREQFQACHPTGESTLESFQWVHELLHKRDCLQTEYGFYAINFAYPDSAISRAFSEWLDEQRAKREIKNIEPKRSSRGGFADKLNWLGAKRIVEHYLPKELVDYPDSNLKVDAPYSHAPDLYENAKKARGLVDEMTRRIGVGIKG